ncbi:hypothetical protein TNCT_553901 [Trichonephila clavata]|uniref:Uncharacterized protein n=1 Tax=Trichonephila clavata TaxID=2740835 RepID=A0A8X6LNN8_TRICU|nr:hypothetical protein TNCT_553901 [Trichonephila clavata]
MKYEVERCSTPVSQFTVGLRAHQIDLSPLLRIEEIQKLSNPSDGNHCPGKENPSDFITRGLSLNPFEKSDPPWWGGFYERMVKIDKEP